MEERMDLKSTNGSPSKDPEIQTFLFNDDQKLTSQPRETWGNRLEFLLALIGYTVGMSSIWRFPILCIRNGGLAFLLPMFLILLLVGGPVYYLEINLGQFSGMSVIKAFDFCPLFRGTGYVMMSLSLVGGWYVAIILGWTIYYLYNSFKSPQPWSNCNNEWNTPQCYDGLVSVSNYTATNVSHEQFTVHNGTLNTTSHPAMEFWTRNVLGKSDGLEHIGNVQSHLAVCLLLAWILSFSGIVKGVKSLGKVVYVTALLPYVLLTILLVRGLTLDGSIDGLRFFLKFESYRLADYQVWLDASVMLFYALGPVWGGIITMSAHNNFYQPSLRDTVIVCVMDILTAVYAALVVYSVIGFMAKQSGIPIEEIATSSGPGLAFVAYPTATSLMPFPQLWAVLFFLTMALVFLDSMFGLIETVICGLLDLFPQTLGRHRMLVMVLFGGVLYLTSLIFTTNGGIYFFILIDWYASGFGLLLGACTEVTSLSLIYGIDRFSSDITMMTGRVMSKFARFLYCVIIPVSTLVTFILMLTQYDVPSYGDKYKYKPYALAIGVTIGLIPVFVFVVCAVLALMYEQGSLIKRFQRSLRPSRTWGPKDQKAAAYYRNNPYVYKTTVSDRLATNLLGSTDTKLF